MINQNKKTFLDFAYNRFNDIYYYLSSTDIIKPEIKYLYLKEVFSIYSELCEDESMNDVFNFLRFTRPPEEELISNEYFNIIRHLLTHFPLYEDWDDISFNRSLIRWNKDSGKIDSFFKKNQGKETVKFRIWDSRQKEMKYYKIGFPPKYTDDSWIWLKDLITQDSGTEFCLIMMKNALMRREV